ncbi:hypothetical protein HPB51_006144 [Rhipicephalus microplus]|uniref:Uncharacterized protein n=1 Tax=Rhipicephalus microplus TaxID=6941 RepID=A0A9J6EQS4_RHIMP|nr:hypothetical protein HPB51_006144 [Rhipicephalus microplus]
MDRLLAQCGCLYGLRYGPEELESLQRSHKIDKMIQKDKQVIRRQVKLLLLGAGESGKSTFLKQMRIIHNCSFEPEQLVEYRSVVYQNVLRGMKVLADARRKLDIPWQNPANEVHAQRLLGYDSAFEPADSETFSRYAPSVRALWQDAGIREAFERRIEFQLGDGVRYFFDHLDRIATKASIEFIPTNQDILHARKATKSITEFVVPVNGVPFRFVDVGGQRSQRQKWFRCFDSVTSILFLVSSSEFDQRAKANATSPHGGAASAAPPSLNTAPPKAPVNPGSSQGTTQTKEVPSTSSLVGSKAPSVTTKPTTKTLFVVSPEAMVTSTAPAQTAPKERRGSLDRSKKDKTALLEDRTTNRLVESRSIFETIVNNRCFAEVSIILFFNKTDLLREKLASRATSIADYIDGFKGDPHNLADVQRFLVNWFYEARRSQHKPLFHHFTTAVDTENIKVVFNAVRDTILQKNITQLMLQ